MTKPRNRPSFLARPLQSRTDVRLRIAAMALLAVASVLAAYFGYPGVSLFLRFVLIGFGLLTLLRLYNTVKQR